MCLPRGPGWCLMALSCSWIGERRPSCLPCCCYTECATRLSVCVCVSRIACVPPPSPPPPHPCARSRHRPSLRLRPHPSLPHCAPPNTPRRACRCVVSVCVWLCVFARACVSVWCEYGAFVDHVGVFCVSPPSLPHPLLPPNTVNLLLRPRQPTTTTKHRHTPAAFVAKKKMQTCARVLVDSLSNPRAGLASLAHLLLLDRSTHTHTHKNIKTHARTHTCMCELCACMLMYTHA